MARSIATVSGVALAPGVSKNGRLYTRETIARAVARAQARLAGGESLDVVYDPEPMTQLTHHAAEDDSTRVVGGLTALRLDENGAARFDARIADTEHGRTIAALLDTSDGEPPFLRGASIRGAWIGKVRKVRGPAGSPVETADDLEIDGLDYTRKPGVTGAGVDTFAWVKGGATETTERVLITESVQEAHVTAITEDGGPGMAPALPDGLQEGLLAALPPPPHIYADGRCASCAGVAEAATNAMSGRGSGLSGKGSVAYADPGYQADKKQRYELDTPAHIRAAWSFISQAKNAKAYTSAQLKRIKGRIKSAASKAGIQIASEGWVISPAFEVTEAVAEMMGDPSCAGSYSLSATNGPTTVTVCSYGLDPADLGVILQAACCAASSALCTLDPDMDGDIDLPGADAEDTDSDAADTTGQFDNGDGTADLTRRIMAAIRGESAEPLEDLIAEARASGGSGVTETSQEDPATAQGAADQETEAPVTETTTQEAAGSATAAPSFSQADLDGAVQRALDAADAKRKADKKARKARAAESAAKPDAGVAEGAAEPDIAALVAEGIKTAMAEQGLTESTEQKVARLVAEGVTAAKQEIAAQGGGPGRKGLVTEHSAARAEGEIPADFPMKDGALIPSEQWSEAQRRAAGAALQSYVLGDRAVY